jgi:hypothetical protein
VPVASGCPLRNMLTKGWRNNCRWYSASDTSSKAPTARSTRPVSISSFSVSAFARLDAISTDGASVRQRSTSTGMKYTSPTSVMASVKRRVLVAASKRLRWLRARATCAIAAPIGSAICWASGVGCMPCAVRTNNSSPKLRRRRASALLTADCVSPRRRAALEIWRSR